MSPLTAFDHGTLPERVAPGLRCPVATAFPADPRHRAWPGYTVDPVPGSGYRAKFRCSECRFEFAVSDAQLRRVVG